MSDQLNNKQNGAMRLFEALSGVDEAYLAACESDNKSAPKGVIVFMHKYGKAMAAVLCLAVLGAGFYAVRTNLYIGSDCDSAAQAPGNTMAERETYMNNEVTADVMEEAEMEEPEMAKDAKVEYSMQSASGVNDLRDESGNTDEINPAAREMTMAEAEALNVVGPYIPENWPEDGAVSQVFGVEIAGEEAVTIFWTYDNGWDEFVVKVDNLGEEVPEWLNEEIEEGTIIQKEDFTKSYVEGQIKTPVNDSGDTNTQRGQLGVLYKADAGYVLVRFTGRGTVEAIWELMQ